MPPRSPSNPDLLYLIRIDGSDTHGWQVRLPPWHPRANYSELFSDSLYGGFEGALTCARARRDGFFKEAALPLRLIGRSTTTSSTSGIIGVNLTFLPKSKGLAAYRWSARWSEDTVRQVRNFEIATHGFDQALMLAVRLREEKVGVRVPTRQIEQARMLWFEVNHFLVTGKRPERSVLPRLERVLPKKLV